MSIPASLCLLQLHHQWKTQTSVHLAAQVDDVDTRSIILTYKESKVHVEARLENLANHRHLSNNTHRIQNTFQLQITQFTWYRESNQLSPINTVQSPKSDQFQMSPAASPDNITSHSMKNSAFHQLLRWELNDYTTNSNYLTWMYFLNLGERVSNPELS